MFRGVAGSSLYAVNWCTCWYRYEIFITCISSIAWVTYDIGLFFIAEMDNLPLMQRYSYVACCSVTGKLNNLVWFVTSRTEGDGRLYFRLCRYVSRYIDIYRCVYICICICVCICVYVYVYVYICIYVYIYIYIHTHTHIYIYIYTYIHCVFCTLLSWPFPICPRQVNGCKLVCFLSSRLLWCYCCFLCCF